MKYLLTILCVGVVVSTHTKSHLSSENDYKVISDDIEESVVSTTTDTLKLLIESLIWVESKGDNLAFCEAELAAGCLQIRPIMVQEVNRILGCDTYSLDDRWDCDLSIEMLKVYIGHYGWENLETIARCWNGGPRGWAKNSTDGYWSKVEHRLEYLNS